MICLVGERMWCDFVVWIVGDMVIKEEKRRTEEDAEAGDGHTLTRSDFPLEGGLKVVGGGTGSGGGGGPLQR